LRYAEVATSSGDFAQLAEALHHASKLVDQIFDCIDPPGDGDGGCRRRRYRRASREGSGCECAAAPALTAPT